MEQDSQDVQVLKLLKAFFQIQSSATRNIIVALAEAAAHRASVRTDDYREKPSETKLN